jgi:hypothetical protein
LLTILAKPDGISAVSQVRVKGRQFWVATAHRDDGKRFIVYADEKLTMFFELRPLASSARDDLAMSFCSSAPAAFVYRLQKSMSGWMPAM